MYVNLIYVVLIVALAILYIIGCGLAKCGNDRIAHIKWPPTLDLSQAEGRCFEN